MKALRWRGREGSERRAGRGVDPGAGEGKEAGRGSNRLAEPSWRHERALERIGRRRATWLGSSPCRSRESP